MSKSSNVDIKELLEFRDKINEFTKGSFGQFCLDTVNNLMQRFIRRVRRLTPEDTGELKKGWKAKKAVKMRGRYTGVVYNHKHYAKYIEYGHRAQKGTYEISTKNGSKGKRVLTNKTGGKWVEGHYMMTKTAESLEADAPGIIQSKFIVWLGKAFNGK